MTLSWNKTRTDPFTVNQLLSDTVHSNTIAGAILTQYAYGYDAGGNRTTEQIGTGTGTSPVAVSQSTYNSDNQVTSRTETGGSMLFAGKLSEPATVTVAGNAATINHQATNFTGYASVTNGTNVVPVIATSYSAQSATNKYQVVVTNNGVAKTITFDLNGNETSVVTSTSTNSYQWDAANRLVSITSPTNQSLFTYDGVGRRVQIIEKTNSVAYITNKYVWDGATLCEQRNSTNSVTKRFFSAGEQISGTNYFFTSDHLGSIREMVDSTGTIQARYSYDPYGRRTKISGSLDADFGYAGYYYHSASGLYLTVLRAYDSDLGRWLSRDPIAEKGGLNLYGYVLNNPINWLDPYGACGGGEVTGGAGGGASTTIDGLGVANDILGNSSIGDWTIGINNNSGEFKLYPSGWGGNGSVATASIEANARLAGGALTVVGIGVGYYNWRHGGSGTQFGADTTISLGAWWWGGPEGAALGAGYFAGGLINEYVPGVSETAQGLFQPLTDWYYDVPYPCD